MPIRAVVRTVEGMGRTDEARLVINASPVRVYNALTDAEAIAQWLPPEGMTGRVERFDLQPGGEYRIVLSYRDPAVAGKSGSGEDVVQGRFVEVEPGVRVVQEVEFESEDPAFAGTMRMTWEVVVQGASAEVLFRAEDVPSGISAEDHAARLASSLRNLARLVER